MNLKKILLLLTVLIGGLNLSAKHIVVEGPVIKIVASNINSDGSYNFTSSSSLLHLTCDKYIFITANPDTWSESFSQKNIKNIVEVYLDYSNPNLFTNSFTFKADLTVRYAKWDDDGTPPDALTTKTFPIEIKIEKDPPTVSGSDKKIYNKDRVVIVIEDGGNYMDASLSNITTSTITTSTPFAPNLFIKNRIELDRNFKFDTQAIPDSEFNPITDETSTKGSINVSWQPKEYAEWYDLEWTFINNYQNESTETDSKLDASAIHLSTENLYFQGNFFKKNSTRVAVTNTSYDIPMLYESGYLIYRVRPVGYDEDKKFIQGSWSINDEPAASSSLLTVQNIINSNPNSVFLFQGHNDDKPWQTSVVYAEEGKNKASASYFDGTLRNRQAVVKNNSDNTVIVGETIYDHNGRPAVNILPAPSGNSKVDFHPDFNLSEEDEKPYDRNDFDLDDNLSTTDGCDTKTNGLSTSSGTSKYYSSNNDDQTGFNAYLPDAEKFPFTQVQYENDNTGRIKRQSGVGSMHKLGSGHEVKYFYDVPSQEELWRLFGYEVGSSERYRKQTVIDANGQATVSYLDPQGRVIATAFKGTTPDNVDELISYDEPLIGPKDLIGTGSASIPETNVNFGKKNLSVQEVATVTNIDRLFKYDLSVPRYEREETCDDGTVKKSCYNCVLDLEISIVDDCGKDFANGFKRRIEPTGDCNESLSNNKVAENFPLVKNSYQQGAIGITKKLTVNEEKLEEYWKEYINEPTKNCLKTEDDFIDAEYIALDPTCDQDCETCMDLVIKDFPEFLSAGAPGEYLETEVTNDETLKSQKYAEYLAARKSCSILCDEADRCFIALSTMIMDMTPNGQYGKIQKGGPTESEGIGVNEEGKLDVDFDPEAIPEDVSDLSHADFKRYLEQFPLSIFNTSNSLPEKNSDWDKPHGWLRDENKRISLIKIPKDQDGNFTIETTEDPELYDKDGESFYYVLPQDLKHVKDFIDNWKPSWASNYVHMHPEYPFYLECKKLKESYQYDEKIRNFYLADAIDEGLIHNDGKDPGIQNSFGPLLYQKDNLIKDGLISDVSFKESLKNLIGNHPTTDRNILEMAHGMVDCPNALGGGHCDNSTCPDGGSIDSDAKWLAYVSLYNTTKEVLLEKHYKIVSKKKGFYNGCIGNDYYSHAEMWSNTFARKWFFGGIDYQTPCGIHQHNKYQNKTPRFPLKMPPTMVGNNAEYCPEDEENFSQVVTIECEEQILATSSQISKRAELSVYEDCGLCPLGKELETFVSGITKFNPELFEIDFPLVCGDYRAPNLSGNLKIGMGLSASNEINFNSNGKIVTTSEGRYKVEGDIVGISEADGLSKSCKLVLELNNKFIDGSDIDIFNFSNTFDICCFSYLQDPQYFNYNTSPGDNTGDTDPGTGFSFTAYYEDNGVTKKIYGEGYTSCIDLGECTMDPVCVTTSVGVDLQNLLTILSFDFNEASAGQGLTKTAVNLGENPYINSVTENLRKNAMDYDDGDINSNWIWSAQIIGGNQLTGTISSVFEGVSQQFMITLEKEATQDFTFNNIKYFSGLRDDEDSVNPADLLINVKALDSNGDEQIHIIKMQINGKSIPVVECTQTINVNYK